MVRTFHIHVSHPGVQLTEIGLTGKNENPAPFSEILDSMAHQILLSRLHGSCHSHDRLRSEGYSLEHPPDTGTLKSTKPHGSDIPYRKFLAAPRPGDVTFGRKKVAIVLECELVETTDRCSLIAFISAVDFFTGEVLINSYVQPDEEVVNWLTPTTGISYLTMDQDWKEGNAFEC